ncbi:Hsp20/alpha crystallin family protein [Neobacillus niacini]|uniref:Hsp20/alpha crystallin family protein n=1 Tax=Neobacillus niacini TaxID=86668 RepID=UPI0021CB881F|nr:Hsp20/alpha crystallin family protein [Neobacillus niacini]MCM3767857.1 Hsp20/alpha crystallin family protein [Neobacillus niacini]
MDMEKLKQWLDLAKNMQGGDFWGNIFDQEFAKQFMNDQQMKMPPANQQMGMEAQRHQSFPNYEILEGSEDVVVIIELPGIMKENIELGISNNILTVKGKAMPFQPNLTISYSERFSGEFHRQIQLPDSVNPGDIGAKFWNGLLIVSYRRTTQVGDVIPIE